MPIRASLLILLICSGPARAHDGDAPLHQRSHLRRPVAIVHSGDALYVANRESGTISVIDSLHRVVDEIEIGKRLSDLESLGGGRFLLATDEQNHELILLKRSGRRIAASQRLQVASYPVSIAVARDNSWCSIASLWSRRLTLVYLKSTNSDGDDPGMSMRVGKTIDLTFAPRAQWMSDDGRWLVVADSFGGRIAVVGIAESAEEEETSPSPSLARRGIVAVRSIEGHNIRGLALKPGGGELLPGGGELLFAHQLLNGQVPTERARVFWGAVVANFVRAVSLKELARSVDSSQQPKAIPHWSLFPLGEPKNAAGDPAEIVVTKDGTFVIALSGVDEVAIGNDLRKPLVRCRVGRRPAAICIGPDEKRVYVANSLDDSLSVVDLETKTEVGRISLGPLPRFSQIERGESLFFDARLSLDGWYSCHSCHTDGHTNGLLNDNFADDTNGAPKRILSLLGVGQTKPWAWNGSRKSLDEQIHKSIMTTMRGDEKLASPDNAAALAAYLRKLQPPPSLAAARGETNDAAVQRGRATFQRVGCADCHAPPTFTTPDTYDVNTHDELGRREFNPPSLRGVSQRDRLFHDNRAASLREVFTRFRHADIKIRDEELDELLEFLNSL